MDAGAQFLISPVVVPSVISWAKSHNIVCLPGCQTPSEAYNAYKLGAPIQKVFPGVAGGHLWMKAVSAALPMLRLNPTSGVQLDNVADFLENGCTGVGLVAPLFDPELIAQEKWDEITTNAKFAIKVSGGGGD